MSLSQNWKASTISSIAALVALTYFHFNYVFYLPIKFNFSALVDSQSSFNILFDSGDGFTSYEKISVKFPNLPLADNKQFISQDLLLPNIPIKRIKIVLAENSINNIIDFKKISLSSNNQEIVKEDLLVTKDLIPEIGTSSIRTKKFHLGIFFLQIFLSVGIGLLVFKIQKLPQDLNKNSWQQTVYAIFLEGKRGFFWLSLAASITVHSIWLLAYWPAAMTNDSWATYYEVRSLNISDWHPYIYSLYVMSLLQFFNSIAVVGIFQIIITATIICYIFYYCYRNRVSLWIILPFLLLFIFSIPVGLMNIIVWKDIPFSIMVTFFSFLVYLCHKNKEFNQGFLFFSKTLLMILALSAILLLHSRHNGVIFYLALPLLLINSITRKQLGYLIIFLMISFISIKKVIPSIFSIKAPVGSAYHELKTILSIMTHFNYYSETRSKDIKVVENFTEDSWENINKAFPEKWFSINDHPAVIRHQFQHKEDDPTNLKKSFIIRLILENLPIFIAARTFELLHSIGLDFAGSDNRNNFYEDPLQLQGSNLSPPGNMIFNIPIKAETKTPESVFKLVEWINLWSRKFGGLFGPSIIVWNLAIFFIFFLFINFKEKGFSAISYFTLPNWIAVLSIFLLGPGESWRYFYYIYLSGIVIIPLYFDYLKSKSV